MRLQLKVIYNTHKTSSSCVLTPPHNAARLAEANDFPESFISDSEILVAAGADGCGEPRGDRTGSVRAFFDTKKSPCDILGQCGVKPETRNF